MANNLSVQFLMSVLGHPRYAKRVDALKKHGFIVSVAAFQRDYHKGRMSDVQTEVLGKLDNGRYLKRAAIFLSSIFRVRKLIYESDIVYAFEPDMAALAIVAAVGLKKKIILEVGDVRDVFLKSGFLPVVLRMLDKLVASKAELLVVTSEAFLSNYYRQMLGVKTVGIVMENKLEGMVERINSAKLRSVSDSVTEYDRIKIGYFGVLRCEWSWSILELLATKYPQRFEVILAGKVDISNDLLSKIATFSNISYLGEYKSPDDLPSLYAQVDLVWACYEPLKQGPSNLRWAIPNRYYEALAFGVPLVVREGTVFAEKVNNLNVGLIVGDLTEGETVELINGVSREVLDRWHSNVLDVEPKVYCQMDECACLFDAIRNLTRDQAACF